MKKQTLETMLTHLVNEMENAKQYYDLGFRHLYGAIFDVVVLEIGFLEDTERITEDERDMLLLALLTGEIDSFRFAVGVICVSNGGAKHE